MNAILEFLNSQIPLVAGLATSWAELVGFITGATCVWLVARGNIWTFPVGMVNAAFFFILFIDARLYTDAWLQVFFFAVQIFGWVVWLKGGPGFTRRSISRITWKVAVPSAIAVAAFVYLMVPVLREAHGAYPVADSSTTGLSVAAQFMLSFKVLENWLLWIVADLIYIPLYAARDLHFTSLLYVVFLCICFHGLWHWWNEYKANQDPIIPEPEEAPVGQMAGVA